MHFVQTKQPRLCSASIFTFHSLNYTAEHVCCHELAQVMAITGLHCSAKHHVHSGRFTNTCQVDADLELKQMLAMICEAYMTLVRATINYVSPRSLLAHYLKTYIYTTP